MRKAAEEETVRLIAAVRQIRGGRLLLPGEEFLATEREAEAFVHRQYATRAVAKPSPRRTYQRRDMKAEGEEEA